MAYGKMNIYSCHNVDVAQHFNVTIIRNTMYYSLMKRKLLLIGRKKMFCAVIGQIQNFVKRRMLALKVQNTTAKSQNTKHSNIKFCYKMSERAVDKDCC